MKYISDYIIETPFNGNDRIIYERIQAYSMSPLLN